jgi:hypothetical protein
MATNKKKKNLTIEASAQIDGKAEERAPQNKFGSLDQILGETISKYKATTTDEYRSQIAEMNQTDLQSHALKIGLIPIEDRKVLVGRLVQEFERWRSTMVPQGTITNDKKLEDMNERIRKILREGA